MARSYAFKDAKNLIKQFENLLKDLASSDNYIKKYEKEINNEIEFLITTGFFQKKISNNLKNSMPEAIQFSEIYNLLKAMYCYFKSVEISAQCINLYKNNKEDILSHIEALSKGKNAIKWLFSNRENKQESENSFDELQNELNSAFYINGKKLLEQLKSINKTDENQINSEVIQNEEQYKSIIFKLFPEITTRGDKITEIKKIINEYDNIINEFDNIDNNFENLKPEIKNSIDKLLASELLVLLKGIPVDELNREKGGIRVKTLMDAGYTNMADIYTSTVSQLASIQGISYSAAQTIKNISNTYAKGVYNGAKIKLSTDNKNINSNKTITLLYYYKIKKSLIIEKNIMLQTYKYDIEQKIKHLEEIGNGIKYYFSEISEKEMYINDYNWLKQIIFGESFGIKSRNLIKQYNSLKMPNVEESWNDFSNNSIEYYNIIEEICPGVLGNNDLYYGLPENLAREIQDECFFPDGLLCTLRQYQEWGVKYILHQEKVLLGDEMGLGKTIQAIATMVSLKNTGATHFLVVCPASVVTNWCREINKHSKLKATMIYGRARNSALTSWLETGGVGVTTFETTQHITFEPNYKYSLLVVDEAHYIKNPNARRSINTEKISKYAERILFMTGTALENKVDEMVNLIRILRPSVANEIKKIAYMSSAPQFREKIATVYYRRKREDVLTELPELIESKEWCTMGRIEENAYENAVLYGSYPDARRLSWNIDDLKYSSKAQRLKELVEEAENEGRKVIVFSFFLNTIQKISEFLGDRCSCPITGSINSGRRQEIIDEFDKAPAGSVLLAQILAGGTGLNIQSASVVIICEPQFKPSIENQAISRAYRMGQARNVLVYRLLCTNTIDEKITDLLEEKQKIFDAFADKSVAAEKSLEIDTKAFGDIIKEEINRINEKHKLNKNM